MNRGKYNRVVNYIQEKNCIVIKRFFAGGNVWNLSSHIKIIDLGLRPLHHTIRKSSTWTWNERGNQNLSIKKVMILLWSLLWFDISLDEYRNQIRIESLSKKGVIGLPLTSVSALEYQLCYLFAVQIIVVLRPMYRFRSLELLTTLCLQK